MASIQRRAGIPAVSFTAPATTGSQMFPLSRMLEIMNATYFDTIIPMVRSLREEHWIDWVSYDTGSLTSPILPIPSVAMGGALRSVELWTGDQTFTSPLVPNGWQVREIPQIPRKMLNWTWGYYVQANNIVLYPVVANTVGGLIVLTYWKRPNLVCNPNNMQQVVSIVGTTINLTNPISAVVPTTWTSGAILDTTSNNSPYDHKHTITSTGRTATTITVSSGDAANIAVGDWITDTGFTPFINVPDEVYSYFAQACAVQCLRLMKSQDGLPQAVDEMNRLKAEALNMLSPRVDDDPQKVYTFTGSAEWSQ
jgi:hypothetical protein